MSFYKSAIISTNGIGMWDAYLTLRQRNACKTKEVPKDLQGFISQDEMNAAQDYSRDKTTFSLISSAKSLIVENLELFFKLPARLYYFVATKSSLPVGSFGHIYAYTIVYDIITTLLGIPLSYYQSFVLEKKHGFSKITVTEFIKDELKSFSLRALLMYPVQIWLIQFCVRRFGEQFPLYFFLGGSLLMLVMTFIFPTFIMPLFNKFTPMEESEPLYEKIKELAKSHDFPLKRVYIVDGSRRSAHSNAYLTGFWKSKRIVLYDTLLEQMKGKDEEILAVLSHELGHWKLNHMYISLPIMLANLMCISYGARTVMFNADMYRQFGFHEMSPTVGFDIFSLVFLQPFMTLFGYGMAFITRVMEFQADNFAVQNNYGIHLREGLFRISRENKSTLTPDPLYSALHYSHPILPERVKAIDEAMKKSA